MSICAFMREIALNAAGLAQSKNASPPLAETLVMKTNWAKRFGVGFLSGLPIDLLL